jgi:hypothetical protein
LCHFGQSATEGALAASAAPLAEEGEQAATAVQGLSGRGKARPGQQGGLDPVERRLADLKGEGSG